MITMLSVTDSEPNPFRSMPTGLDFWGDVGNNALAFGAGLLDGATFGASSAILGAVVPGYGCLTSGSGWFTAGSIVGTVASSLAATVLTGGAAGGLAIAGIAGRLVVKEAVSIAFSEARRLVLSGAERVLTRVGGGTVESEAVAGVERESVDLFRHVGSSELADVKATGGFRAGPNSMEGKWFAETAQGAKRWGTVMDGASGSVLRVNLPARAVSGLFRSANLDGIGAARYVAAEELEQFNRAIRAITEIQ